MKKITTRAIAIRNSDPKYYTGLPCKHGHVSERFTVSGSCSSCLKMHKNTERRKIAAAIQNKRDDQ